MSFLPFRNQNFVILCRKQYNDVLAKRYVYYMCIHKKFPFLFFEVSFQFFSKYRAR
jgi:hypothetical protein